MKKLFLLLILFYFLVGCSAIRNRQQSENVTITTGQIIAEEQLSNDSDADFIFYNDVVYILSSPSTVDVSEEQLEEIGSVEAEYNIDVDKTILSSTNLEKNTKVYRLNDSDNLFVIKNELIIKYEALPEG